MNLSKNDKPLQRKKKKQKQQQWKTIIERGFELINLKHGTWNLHSFYLKFLSFFPYAKSKNYFGFFIWKKLKWKPISYCVLFFLFLFLQKKWGCSEKCMFFKTGNRLIFYTHREWVRKKRNNEMNDSMIALTFFVWIGIDTWKDCYHKIFLYIFFFRISINNYNTREHNYPS